MWHPFASPSKRLATQSRPGRCRRAARPRLEALEGRVVLSVAFDSVLDIGADATSVYPQDLAVDAAGNTYHTGIFFGTVDFDPTAARADGSDVLTPRGSSDAFVAKYAPDNTLVWARRMGGDIPAISFDGITPYQSPEGGEAVAIDGSGNVYVTGDFSRQADFGGLTLTSTGNTDAYVAKLDPGGNFLWARRWGVGSMDVGSGIAVDPAGNVVATGWNANATPSGYTMSGFEVHRYSPSGAEQWAHKYANLGGGASGVATDSAGNIYVGGYFNGTLDFDPHSKRTHYVTGLSKVSSGSAHNAFVLKLSAAGTFAWVAPLVAKTTDSRVSVADLALDPSGNIAIGGNYRDHVDFDPNSRRDYRLPLSNSANGDGYVAKITPAGGLAWATPLGGARVYSVTVDGAGATYATGYFLDTFTPGFGLPAAASNGGSDVFVAKLNATGSVAWATTFGGIKADYGYGVAVGADGRVYVAGSFTDTVDFDPDPVGIQARTRSNRTALYLLKLRQL